MLHWATVTSTSPLRVTFDGAATATNARRNSGYTPTVADRVAVVRLGSEVLIVCKVT